MERFIKFYKYQGAGNDFVMIDNIFGEVTLSAKDIVFLCDRHKGVGADGVILLESADNYDFRMTYYNSDGTEAEMCGNGARCIALFAHHLGIGNNNKLFIALDGEHEATIIEDDGASATVAIKMVDIDMINSVGEAAYQLDSGVQHYVEFVRDVNEVRVESEGAEIRYDSRFADIGGVNVNYVSIKDSVLYIRTYEKGVEGETLACGTGSVAAAVAAYNSGRVDSNEVKVITRGGELTITFEKHFKNIKLIGAADKVFSGVITIKEKE